ncbi:UNVERIFIED_CONTAM: hypothetical protein Slati_4064900 [Sesamum latifolium]|uniref:Uncharacterized protein n=1 Tax=Sesamum latifolium TaxID=2727402 RepID=A0AAW2TRM2_9LAMI
MEAKPNTNTLSTAIIISSSQTIHPAGATTTTQPPLKVHPSAATSARTPFSAIAPPQYVQVSRLRLRVTLDTISEESNVTDDYDCTDQSPFSDVDSSSEECVSGDMSPEETSELVVLEMAVSSYRTCFREMRGKAMPAFTPYDFRCV